MMITLARSALVVGGLTVVVGSVLFWRRVRSNAALLDAIIDGQLPGMAGKPVKPEATTRPTYPAADPSRITDKRVNGKRPIFCHAKHPSIIQRRMFGRSSRSLAFRSWSGFSGL